MTVLEKRRNEILASKITVDVALDTLINTSSIGYDFHDIYLNRILEEKNAEKLFKKSKINVGKLVSLQGIYKINNSKYNSKRGSQYILWMLF